MKKNIDGNGLEASPCEREGQPIGKLGVPITGLYQGPPLDLDYEVRLFSEFTSLARKSPLGQSVSERFKTDPRCSALNGQMLNHGSGGSKFEVTHLVAWWLWRANEFGEQQANKEIENFLSSEHFDLLAVLWVYSVEPTERLQLTEDVQLVPICEMPDTGDKEKALRSIWERETLPVPVPRGALVTRFRTRKLLFQKEHREAVKLADEKRKHLSQIALLLNCLPGVCCAAGYSTYYFPPEVPLGPFSGRGGVGPSVNDIISLAMTQLERGNEGTLSDLVNGYGELTEDERRRLILLCHKGFSFSGLDRPLRQHGHLCCACASRTARRRLTVGIEFAT